MSFSLNPLLGADSYKYNHIRLYPKGITEVYSNFTPRSVKHLTVPEKYKTNEIVWFGGQAVIKDMIEMWDEKFFYVSNFSIGEPSEFEDIIEEFSTLIAPFAGADYSVEHLYKLHKLGYLPLEIKTLPEGSRVPVGVPVLTVRNTMPEFYWLTNFIETYLSAELWKMSTSATIADYYRKIGEYWAEKTGGNKAFIDFQFHDFSYRGMSGSMDAIKSGAGHLTSFKGSDTVPSVDYINYHYSGKDTFVAASVPATEHSIQCAYQEDDYTYFSNSLDLFTTGIVSLVADGYDYWAVLTDVLPKLKNKIMARKPDAMGFAKTVIRPDSGDPVRIIAGYNYGVYSTIQAARNDRQGVLDAGYEIIATPFGKFYKVSWVEEDSFDNIPAWLQLTEIDLTLEEVKGSIQVLWELFGGTVNEKGYKTLDQHIGLIYGDSITLERAEEILKRLEAKGFASDNVVFGVGSYTYQYNTRDTLGFAMKATNITIDGVDVPLFKDPKTDNGTKKSAKGLLMVDWIIPLNGEEPRLAVFDNQSRENESQGELATLFKDGEFYNETTFAEIRERLDSK